MVKFRVKCPKCAQGLKIREAAAGKTIQCPACQQNIHVPADAAQRYAAVEHDKYVLTCLCGTNLVVSSSLAGKQGTCSVCKRVFDVPASDALRALQPADIPECQPFTPAQDPLGTWAPSADPLFGAPVNDPLFGSSAGGASYSTAGQSTTTPVYRPVRAKSSRSWNSATPPAVIGVKVCGIVLIILACINAVFHLVSSFQFFMTSRAELEQRAMQSGVDPMVLWLLGVVMFLVMLLWNGSLGYGGYAMFSMSSWGFALAGCILALVPCACPTAIFSIPLGIGGIVLLSQNFVRAQFDAGNRKR